MVSDLDNSRTDVTANSNPDARAHIYERKFASRRHRYESRRCINLIDLVRNLDNPLIFVRSRLLSMTNWTAETCVQSECLATSWTITELSLWDCHWSI